MIDNQNLSMPEFLIIMILTVKLLFSPVVKVRLSVVYPLFYFKRFAKDEGNVLERIQVLIQF